MNDQMNQAQINATLSAVGEQRNAAMNQSALLSGQLAIALQDIEGLNKVIDGMKTPELGGDSPDEITRLKKTIGHKDTVIEDLWDVIHSKDRVISGLEAQLKDLRGDHLPKGAVVEAQRHPNEPV